MVRELGVFFREFPSGDFEIGVLEDWGHCLVMDVGDFAYNMSWDSFAYPFTFIGLI